MTESIQYIVVGRGRWATRMRSILSGENRVVVSLENARQGPREEQAAYFERMRASFRASGAQIAWLCVPPGSHIPILVEAAIAAGLHAVAEKPWLCSAEETRRLEEAAKSRGRLLAIHYEYCLLEAAEKWRREWGASPGLGFGGRLNVNRPNHVGLPALDNLGSHLFSIHEYCVPASTIESIECDYERPDDRRVWLEKQGKRIAGIDLLGNKEPIIQRFLAGVEAGIRGAKFPFDLKFALQVAERTALWRQQTALPKEP